MGLLWALYAYQNVYEWIFSRCFVYGVYRIFVGVVLEFPDDLHQAGYSQLGRLLDTEEYQNDQRIQCINVDLCDRYVLQGKSLG